LPLVPAESGTDPFEILPLDAVVHQSSAHAVGGVITPGEQIMLVAPETDALTVAIKICTRHCARWKYRSDYTVSAKSLLLGPSNELIE